jgi:putative phage-type endonuclease
MISNWHEWRRNGIGSSDAAILMNGSHFGRNKYDLYLEKTGESPVREGNIYTNHGKEYESHALNWFQDKKGCTLLTDIRSENLERPWIRATLDGIDSSKKYLVEAKCPYNLENHEKVKSSMKVPAIYYPQCQHQLIVERLDGMYFLSYNYLDPEDSVILEVERDEKYQSKAMEVYEEFWDRVKNRTPPENPLDDYLSIDGDKQWEEATKGYLETDALIKALEDKKTSYRGIMISLSQGRNAVGSGVKLQRQLCKGLVDYSSIPELKGVDLEPYRKKPFEKWVVRSA